MEYWLIVLQDGGERRFRLDRELTVLGQATDCDVRIVDPTVSRRHAQLRRSADGFVLIDLQSTNGSFVARERVSEAAVGEGSTMRFGDVVARIERLGAADLALRVDVVASPRTDDPRSTQVGGASARFLLSDVPQLLRQLRGGASTGEIARAAVAALAHSFSDLQLSVLRIDGASPALLAGEAHESFAAARATAQSLDIAPFRYLWRAGAVPPELPALLSLLGEVLLGANDAPPHNLGDSGADTLLPTPAPIDTAVLTLYRTAARVAPARDIHVLIEGESGTGKELLANYLHKASGARGALVALNCAALPRDLLEAELFGIERGVATGVDARAGKFEQADGGTLFLDEIGEMSGEVQAKLLRVLQEGQVLRLGGRAPRRIDVRIVAATNRELVREVESGRFRLDLYHRIADWSVRLPALRERPADLLNLAAHFLESECRKRGLASVGLSRDAVQALRDYDWPGNVRELEREMRRAALFLENGQILEAAQLSERVRTGAEAGGGRESALEESALRDAIRDARGNMSAAAQRLGVARSTLYRRMKALGIPTGDG